MYKKSEIQQENPVKETQENEVLSADLTVLADMLESLLAHQSACKDASS